MPNANQSPTRKRLATGGVAFSGYVDIPNRAADLEKALRWPLLAIADQAIADARWRRQTVARRTVTGSFEAQAGAEVDVAPPVPDALDWFTATSPVEH